MAILRYFEAALQRRDDVNLYTVGPYTGTWIPWNGGMNLLQKYAKSPNRALPDTNYQPVPINFIESQLPFKPDVWLQIDAGFYFLGKPRYGVNVIVATDPHVLNYDRQRQFADLFYCMQTPYARPGDKYLPYAYDPIWHSPEEQPQNYDVAFIGMMYPERQQLVQRLRAEGIKVIAQTGPIFDEAREIYNQAPISFNWSSKLDLCARVFELAAMKRAAVVNDVPDLEMFFEEGQDLMQFCTVDGALNNIKYLLAHQDDLLSVSENGYQAVQPHTWDARISQILEDCEVI